MTVKTMEGGGGGGKGNEGVPWPALPRRRRQWRGMSVEEGGDDDRTRVRWRRGVRRPLPAETYAQAPGPGKTPGVTTQYDDTRPAKDGWDIVHIMRGWIFPSLAQG